MDGTAFGMSGLPLWALLVTVATVGGLVLYFGFGTWLYWRYYVKRRDQADQWKIQANRWQPPAKLRWGIRVAAVNMVLGGLVSGSFAYYVVNGGYSALYFEVEQRGVIYTIVSTVLLFFAIEAAAYYTHRFLHRKWLFRRVHQWHHRCVATTPFNTVTMHPVEFLLLQVTAFLPIFILPAHYVSFIAMLVYALVFNIMDHSGIKMTHWLPWHSNSSFHDDHHVYFHCNFGQNIAIFDKLHGTHRRHNRRYGENVFGGKGLPVDPADRELGEFVRYR